MSSKERVEFLERDEEYRLAVAYKKGDRRAGNKLMQAYRPFAYRLAFESACPMDLEDKQQIAMAAMFSSLEQFDPETGFRISTFARSKIEWALKDATEFAMRRPFTETSPSREDIHEHHDMPDEVTSADMIELSDEWSKRHEMLEEAINDLDALDADLVRGVILGDGKPPAGEIIRRHKAKVLVRDAVEGATARLMAAATARARRSGLIRH